MGVLDSIKSNVYIFVYAILALAIIGTFFSHFFLTLDTAFAPSLKNYSNDLPAPNLSYLIMEFLSFLSIPGQIIEWIFLFFILLLSGTSMYYLIEKRGEVKSPIAKYFAGFLYTVNPFVYVRFMAGHTLFLLGYALFPLILKFLLDFLEETMDKKINKRTLIIASFGFLLIGATAIHNFFLVLFVFGILFLWALYKHRNKFLLIERGISLGIIVLLLNSYWIIPAIMGGNTTIEQITQNDVSVFKTVQESEMNVLISTATMYGFWRGEAYIQPKDILPVWLFYLIFLIILYFCIYGFLVCEDKFKLPLIICSILAFLLAVGISRDMTSKIFDFIFNNFTPMKIFREPQKFVSLLVFAYAFFGAYGIDSLIKKCKDKMVKNKINRILFVMGLILILAIPFLFTPTLFFNFWGQIKPVDYPLDWYEINQLLNNDSGDFNVLFLPWHQYLDLKWLPNRDKRIANPASIFFDKPIIAGDNMEVGNIYSSSSSQRSRYIEFLLAKGKEGKLKNLGDNLILINVKYILLTKEVDYQSYSFLFNQSNLELIKETDNFYVFKNNVGTNRFYQTNEVDWSSDDPEPILNMNLENKLQPLGYAPVLFGYRIENTSMKYVVFTEDLNQYWSLGSIYPIEDKIVNVYETEEIESNKVSYLRKYVLLGGEIVSIISFLAIIYLYFRSEKSI